MPGEEKEAENRKHLRRNYLGAVRYCLDSGADGETLIGSGVDISESGICMFTSYPLRQGQAITLKSSLPVPVRKATVKWVRQLRADFYQAGLEFVG
ncbi:MAG: PilZ domain-containing protein [Nitrospirae bacterium]|nr:PilZ domain-containing protein [Nitrospirota bacterium]